MFEPIQRVAIKSTHDPIEAEMLRGVLESEGLQAKISERISAGVANRLTRTMHGVIYDVTVFEKDGEIAVALLEAYDRGRGELSEEELMAAADASYDPRV